MKHARRTPDRVRYHVQQEINHDAPLFEQCAVQTKVSKFHYTLASISSLTNVSVTCIEWLPNLLNVIAVRSDELTECRRCNHVTNTGGPLRCRSITKGSSHVPEFRWHCHCGYSYLVSVLFAAPMPI